MQLRALALVVLLAQSGALAAQERAASAAFSDRRVAIVALDTHGKPLSTFRYGQ